MANRELALIDGDVLVYRTGFAYENEPLSLCLWNVTRTINSIVDSTGASKYLVYLTSDDKSNFRFAIRSDYKANRKAPKPKHYKDIRRFLVDKHNAKVCTGIEADDAIGIRHSGSNGITCVCSIDKDFRQVPGWNFHFVRKELDWISGDEAESFFWQQVLTGDRVDNIYGIKGIGPAKAAKHLEACTSTRDYLRTCRALYLGRFPDGTGDLRFVENLNLLRIKQNEGEQLVTLDHIEAVLSSNLPLYLSKPA